MKNRNKLLLIVALGFLLLVVLGYGVYGGLRYITRAQYPLVLIQSPHRQEQVVSGTDVMLHATSRSSVGIDRMEFWVDGELIAERHHPEASSPSPFGIFASWMPGTLGEHLIVARAFSANGVPAQASLRVEVIEGDSPLPDDLSLADRVSSGVPPQEEERAAGADPGAGPGVAPDASGSDFGEAPGPDSSADPPGSLEGVIALMGFYELADSADDAPWPDNSRLEVLHMLTDADYERVYCYASIAPMPMRWLPDVDGNQDTDEYFERVGPGEWDIAAHLAGSNSINLDQFAGGSIMPQFQCVGIVGGGTEAVQLGRVNPHLSPEDIDGSMRQIISYGGEGSFRIVYVAVPSGRPPGAVPMMLDPTMTPPHNVRLEGARLRWDYEPREDEEPIDGFRIYLDNNLLWEVEADVRSNFVPAQSLQPPCGESYRFHLESFRGEDWSLPSNFAVASSDPGDRGCRQVRVRFNTLTTGNLGGDDDRDPGDVGPVTGSFEANDDIARYSGLCDGCNWSELGLLNNREYPVNGPNGLTTDPNWLGTGPAEWLIDVPMGEGLFLGFEVTEYDRHTWYTVCLGNLYLEDGEFAESQEGIIESDMGPGECEVSYSIQLVDEHITDVTGAPPLPQLSIDEITLSSSGDTPVLHFVNEGTGDWAFEDIQIRVSTHDGEFIGFYDWPEQLIPVGEGLNLVHPRLSPERPLDICVEIDPYDEVVELYEFTGAFAPGSREYCRPLPDLEISAVAREFGTSNLLISVQNVGDGKVESQQLGFELQTAYGDRISRTFPEPISLDPWGASAVTWDVSEELSAVELDDGYTIILNPSRTIAEIDESNNRYEVAANANLAFLMGGGSVRWYPLTAFDPCEPDYHDAEEQTQVITFNLNAYSAFGTRSLGSMSAEYDIRGAGTHWAWPVEERWDLEIGGTESLRITVSGEVDKNIGTLDIGSAVFTPLTAEDNWGAHEVLPLYHCVALEPIGFVTVYPPELRQSACGPWRYTYKICMEGSE